MLAALGPRLRRLSMQGQIEELQTQQRSHDDLVPAILLNCPLLVHLEVENLPSSTAYRVRTCQHSSASSISHAPSRLSCTALLIAPKSDCGVTSAAAGQRVHAGGRNSDCLRRWHAAASCTYAVGVQRCDSGHTQQLWMFVHIAI
jgi:hypothetical protein